MDLERKFIMKALMEEKVTIALKAWYKLPTKSTKESTEARKEGNKLFVKSAHNSQVHEIIWKFYSQSIAKAPIASEDLALAYGNRSALLLHLQKFKESISDIDRALKITNSNTLKEKLLSRKTQCLTGLTKCPTELACSEYASTKYSLDKVQNENKMLDNNVDKDKVSLEINKSNFNEKKLSEDLAEIVSVKCFNSSNRNNKDDDKAKIQEILFKKKVADPFDLVYLQHSEKYGRHLVANRYIKPGQIIMVLKPYITCMNLNNMHAFCSHCLKISWASIPCDHCNWCMFCSEECKSEAWQKYHDIECSVIPYIIFNQPADYWKQLALKSTIIAIKEAGGIAELKTELKKNDSSKSNLYKGFLNGKFYNDRFQSIYSLSSNVSSKALEKHIDHAILTLIILAKSTILFGEKVKFINNTDLLSNEDVIFIGLLLLKFMKISDINAHSVMEGSSLCRFSKDIDKCQTDRCCERGACLAPVPSLINHSCNPNIRKCFTEDMHLIVYALQPIKKNSQLFDSYIGYYFQKSRSDRQLLLQEFNFTCSCPPCKENWPAILIQNDRHAETIKKENCEVELTLLHKHQSLFESTDDVHAHYYLNTIDHLSADIEKATSQLIQPSHVTALLISTLWTVFDFIYGIKLQVTDKCND